MKKIIITISILLSIVIAFVIVIALENCGSGLTIRYRKTVGDLKLGTVNGKWYVIGLKDYNDDDIIFPEDLGVSKVYAGTFTDKNNTRRVYPNVTLGPWITEVSLPSITNLYYDSTLEEYLKVTYSEPLLKSSSNIYFLDENGSEQHNGKKYTKLSGNLTIPSSVKNVPDNAFGYLQNRISDLIIEDGVEKIGNEAFSRSIRGDLNLPHTITEIGVKAFEFGYYDSVTIPNGCKSIGTSAFYNCEFMKEIFLPESLTYIGPTAFGNCFSLNNVIIPNSMTSLSDYAFRGCKSLDNIQLSNNLEHIGQAFEDCDKLVDVTLPNTLKSMEGTFMDCDSLVEITIPNSVTSMKNVFVGCDNLKEVKLSYNLTELSGCFKECPLFDSINLPDSLKIIGDETFMRCDSLVSVSVPNSVVSIGNYAFSEMKNLESVSLSYESNLTKLGDSCFSRSEKLKSIYLPDTVLSIGESAFYNCYHLESVRLSNEIVELKPRTFYHCSNITNISLPEKLESIGVGCFIECRKLKNIKWNNNLKLIERFSLFGCSELSNIVLSDNVVEFLGVYDLLINLEYIVVPKKIKKLDINALRGNKVDYAVYYCGSKSDWGKVKIYSVNPHSSTDYETIVKKFDDSRVCFYSEDKPSDNLNKYWRYVDGEPKRWDE